MNHVCGAVDNGVSCGRPATVIAYLTPRLLVTHDGIPGVGVALCAVHHEQAQTELERFAAQLAAVLRVVDNTPLGYTTEHEHTLLERFADKCLKRMRALVERNWWPGDIDVT
jgi:hypothetical protein